MGDQREKVYRASILAIPGVGSQRLRWLIAAFGSAYEAWNARETTEEKAPSWLNDFFLAKRRIDPEQVEQVLKKEGVSLVAREEKHYPCLLAECSDAPPLLFYKGTLQAGRQGIAIVGARRATPYGKAAAAVLARELAQAGYVIVSGLARGIDSAAHQGALEVQGTTWAFLAGGLDYIYPPENNKLAQAIMAQGALLSEYPPGMPTEAGQFPARNRLISGASRGVIVVEAALRSGALITVDFALEQGREVYAVPGPIFSELSRGTHHLLKIGAKLVESKEDILSELIPMSGEETLESKWAESVENKTDEYSGSSQEEEILRYLSDTPVHIDRLAALCNLTPREIALNLLEMQLKGIIIHLPGQHYVLNRKKEVT